MMVAEREKEQPETWALPKPRAMRKNRRFCLMFLEETKP